MSEVDLSSSEAIQPSSIFPQNEAVIPDGVRPTLQYLPSLKCFALLTNPQLVTFINVDPGLDVKHCKHIELILDNQFKPRTFSLYPERSLLALGIPDVFFAYEHRIPAHVQLAKMPPPSEPQVIRIHSTLYITPHIFGGRITEIKFFPDGSRLLVTYSNERQGSWCKIFTLIESWDDCNSPEEWSDEKWSVPASNKTLPCDDIDVFKQGFPTVDEKDEKINDPELTSEDYFRIYNERYFSSNLDGGFYCLAISPDTTRLLAGTNDGEIYVIDSTTLKVQHCKREYGFCKTVTGCCYNPLFGSEEFAVCNEIGILDIWNIATLEDGCEEASKVHHLQFPPGTSNCVYSPDGKLIALTSAGDCKTYIISSTSCNIVFTLLYKEYQSDNFETYFLASSVFFGNLCQVATIHRDHITCMWKLPVVYSLKTLCLILLRGRVKYNDIEQLCVPSSLKLLLKYLYV